MTMKANTMGHGIKARLFAVVLLAGLAFGGSANAQTIAAKFTLPFEVHWGKAVLPAGQYTISMDSLAEVALIRSANGKAVGFTPIPTRASSDKGAAALFVMVRGHERQVRSLNLPGRGVSLIYQPTTNAEREMLAKADKIQAVPVITAGK
jgi:hypothetical protein